MNECSGAIPYRAALPCAYPRAMAPRIDLIWLGSTAGAPAWTLGEVVRAEGTAASVHGTIDRDAQNSRADAWLFWDSSLPLPADDRVTETFSRPGDLWHVGLALGLGGAPGIIDFISPTWTFNRDPDAKIEATSWRVSLRACLVRMAVLRWSPPRPDFDTLDAASLEWGHRCIMYGVLPRTAPRLIARRPSKTGAAITLADELRFARARFGTRWAAWAAARAAMTNYAPFEELANAWLSSRSVASASNPSPYSPPRAERRAPRPAVTVLIPTLDRYGYLRTILSQFRTQTVKATEIIVVDQTPRERRDARIAADFRDLPLQLVELDKAGQCTARNAGLVRAAGDAILFVDDDDEIESDLIARHLDHLTATRAEVSSGVAREPTSGPIPEAFTRSRASDVFPTNNTLARRSALERSGLFDLAYDHGARADGDLGMRVYLSGAVMMLDPGILLLHHHAPQGGLRAHGARVVTYASSRRRITHRNLPELTELYCAFRYFSTRQVHEAVIHSALGTLSVHGGLARRTLKLAFGLLVMPGTLMQLRRRLARARAMLDRYPQIPPLPALPTRAR